MTTLSSRDRYSTASITLHWLMLLLLVAVFAAMELREFYPKGSDTRELFKSWHYTLGLTVFVLVWLRILARVLTLTPRPLHEPAWRSVPARAAHLALYAFMVVMPLAGWALLSAEGDSILFWGLSLPALIPANEVLGVQIKYLHQLGGDILFWLIAFHAAASLLHHYVLKDRLLNRMLPARR
ncbi:cytochrome b [Blastomonas sp.]|uniref:cytochrome b n=1 Tax=Blastomonas sp. TaxID=1909299 RepID=UPI0035930668